MSVVYADWKGEEWLPNGGRRCRHLPTKAVFDCWFDVSHEVKAVLRQGVASRELFELARGYFMVFGCINPDHQPPGNITSEQC